MTSRFDLRDLRREAVQRLLDGRDWLREHPEKATGCALLFVVLIAIYARYLVDFLHAGDPGAIDTGEWLGAGYLARFALFAGWPFALIRWIWARWTLRDAWGVALAAYGVAAAFWLHHYDLQACLIALDLLFAPLVVSAVIGHAVGCLRPAAMPADRPPKHPGADARSVQTRSWESLVDDDRSAPGTAQVDARQAGTDPAAAHRTDQPATGGERQRAAAAMR